PTAVARINGGIGLQKALEWSVAATRESVPAFCADDSVGHGVIKSKGAANREHPVSDLDRIGISHLRGRQFTAGFNFDHGQIGFLIAADDFRLILGLVFKSYGNLCGLVDDVMIGHDEARFVHDKASAQATNLLVTVRQVGSAEEIEEV